MKASQLAATVAAATTLLAGTCSFAADKTESTMAFRVTGDNRYISTVAKGGLNAQKTEITARQTFVLVDLNGGELAEGDSIQIKWAPADTKPTYWHEGEGSVNRIGGKSDAACTFKIKLKESAKDAPKSVVLQTAGGKFVSVPTEKGAALATIDTEDKATTLDIVDVPTPKAAE